MKHFITIILLSFCWMTGAHARMSVSAPPVFSFCPFGDVGNGSNPDGCGQAPQPGLTPGVSGQVWHTDCFAVGGFINQYAGTSSNYTTAGHRPSENVPGCDYPVGSTIADANLLDPQTHTPAGCTYNATGGVSGSNGVLTCGGSSWAGLNGLMMGPIGTHGCTSLVLNNSGAGTNPVIISNSHWTNDGNCTASGGFQPAFINGPSTAYPIVYAHLTLDGDAQQFPQPQGTCATLACSASQGIQLKGDSIIGQYNAVVNFGSKSIIYNNSNLAAPFIWQYNFGAGWMMAGNVADHAEFATDQFTVGSSERLVDHNVIVQATLNNGAAFAPWAQGLTGGFTVNGPFEFDSNVVVGAFTGGMPSNASMTGVIGCGDPPVCSVDGSKFYVTAVTGGAGIVGTGPTFTCAGVFGELSPVNVGGAATSAGIGGAYVGGAGSWFGMNLGSSTGHSFTGFIDDGTGGGSPSGHAGNILTITSSPIINVAVGYAISGTGIGGGTSITAMSPTSPYTGTGQLGTYAVNGSAISTASETIGFTVSNIFEGSWTMPPTTCTSTTLSTQSSPVGFLEAHNANIQGASEIKKNFIDILSSGAVPSFTMDNPGASCTSPTVFGGNVNMTTGNLDTLMNQWTTPGTGC